MSVGELLKLLLLTIPELTILWSRRECTRRLALLLTTAGILFTADIPLAVLSQFAKNLPISAATLSGKLAILFFLRPAPLILSALGCFYRWAYLRYSPTLDDQSHHNDASATSTLTRAGWSCLRCHATAKPE